MIHHSYVRSCIDFFSTKQRGGRGHTARVHPGRLPQRPIPAQSRRIGTNPVDPSGRRRRRRRGILQRRPPIRPGPGWTWGSGRRRGGSCRRWTGSARPTRRTTTSSRSRPSSSSSPPSASSSTASSSRCARPHRPPFLSFLLLLRRSRFLDSGA